MGMEIFNLFMNEWYRGFHTGLFCGIGVATAAFVAAGLVGLLVRLKQ